MRKSFAIAAAAALAISGFSYSPVIAADPDTTANQNQNANTNINTADATGQNGLQSADIQGVRDLLARATNDATTENGLSDLRTLFVEPNSNPAVPNNNIGALQKTNSAVPQQGAIPAKSASADVENGAMTDFNGRVAQFQSDWKAKFNQDFHVDDAAVVYADIQPSNVVACNSNPNSEPQAASAQIPAANGVKGKPAENARETGNTVPNTNNAANSQVSQAAQANCQTYALTLPAHGKSAPVTLTLVRQPTGEFRFASSPMMDNITLEKNMVQQLQAVDDHKDRWPSDLNKAERTVSNHIFMAISRSDNGAQAGVNR
jgi:hypothetical protein